MYREKAQLGDAVGASLTARQGLEETVDVYAVYEVWATDKNGNEKWRESFRNLVTTVGKNDILDKYFKGSAYTAAWYVGLKGAGSAAATDTMASHAGWSEVTAYSQGSRQALALGTPSNASVTSSGAAQFSITSTVEVAGAFLVTDNTKGGTSGTLYSAGNFSTSRNLVNGDTLNVNSTLQA